MNFYQVQIDVPESLKSPFLSWLTRHMDEMVELPTFTHYQCLEQKGPDIDGGIRLQIRYFYDKPEDFEVYLEKYAPAMRGDLPEEWRSQLIFSRHLGTLQAL